MEKTGRGGTGRYAPDVGPLHALHAGAIVMSLVTLAIHNPNPIIRRPFGGPL